MRKFILITLLSFKFCLSQTNKIDSLKQIIKTTKNDSVKVDTYNKLSWKYIFNNKDEALKVLNTTEKYALNKNQKYGYNTFLNNKGVFFDVNGMSDSAKIYFEKAANYSVKNKFPIQEQYSYNNLGMYFWNKGKFQDALTSFFKSLKLAEENVKKDATIKVDATLNNIGLIYQEMTLYEKALPYHQKALKIRSQRKFEQGESSSYNNLGICYKELNKISLAKQSFESGILKATLAQDKVIYYQNLEGLASVYVIENQNKKALELFLESYNRSKEIPFSSNSFVHVTSSISKLYLKLNNTKKAIEFGEMCVSKINEEKSTEYYEPEVYKTLAESYYKVGDSKKGAFYNNLFYQNTINKFKESNGKALQELETKYETEKKERELFQSKAENSIKEAQIQKKNGLIFGGFALAFLLGLIGFLYSKQQKLKQKQIIQEKELNEQLLKVRHQNNLHEQRLAISKDLHDNIGAQLTFIISSIDNLKYFDLTKEKLNNKYDFISQFTKNTIIELRDTIWAMNKEEIALDDLKNRIYNFIEAAKISLQKINFQFNTDNEIANIKFKSKKGIIIYRFIQEAINNAIKHANAKTISVEIKKEKDLVFVVSDDGKGFDNSFLENENYLASLKKSAKLLKTNLEVDSNTNGTKISIMVPAKVLS